MSGPSTPWPAPVRLGEVARGPVNRHLAADADARQRIARDLGLERLDRLEGDLTVTPWLDGAQVTGRWSAAIEQTCSVTLEPLSSELEGEIALKVVPAGSPNAPGSGDKEVVIDLEADDPPDILEGEAIDLGAYLVEHLALQIDPFPKKPGAVFVQPDEPQPASPFAVLRNLKPDRG